MKRFIQFLPLLALVACGSDPATPSAESETFDLAADAVGFGTRQTMLRDGVVAGVITADTAYLYDAENRTDLFGVDVIFHDERGAEAGTLTSDTGEYDESVFIARGNAVLVTQGPEGPRRVETEELHFDLRNDRVWADTPFTLEESGRVSTGTSFRTDFAFTEWEVFGMQTSGAAPGNGGIQF